MSITSLERLFTGRGGSQDFGRRRTYREQWEVLTDSLLDDEQVVGNALGLPRLGRRNPRDVRAFVVKVTPDQSEDTPYRWVVTVEYDSHPDLPTATNPDGAGQDPETVPENPLLRATTWKINGQKTSEPVINWRVVDALGNMAVAFTLPVNSAKLPFDPPLMCEVSRPVIRLTKNVPAVSMQFLLSLQDAVNDRVWQTLPKWTARIDNYDAQSKIEGGVAFVELSIDIALRRETWVSRLLDSGLMELGERQDPVTFLQVPVWTKIRDPFGKDADTPQMLDGAGKRLKPGADPVFLRGLPINYHLADFATLLNL